MNSTTGLFIGCSSVTVSIERCVSQSSHIAVSYTHLTLPTTPYG